MLSQARDLTAEELSTAKTAIAGWFGDDCACPGGRLMYTWMCLAAGELNEKRTEENSDDRYGR